MWKQPRAGGGRTPANPADNPSTVGVLGNGMELLEREKLLSVLSLCSATLGWFSGPGLAGLLRVDAALQRAGLIHVSWPRLRERNAWRGWLPSDH